MMRRRPAGKSRILAGVLARFATPQRPWRAWPYKYPNIVQIQRVGIILEAIADGEALVFPDKAADIDTFAVFAWAFMAEDSLALGNRSAVLGLLKLVGIAPSPGSEGDWLETTWEVVRAPGRFLHKTLESALGYLLGALWRRRKARSVERSREIPVADDDLLWMRERDPEPGPEERVLDQEEIRERIRAYMQVLRDLLAEDLPQKQRQLLLLLLIGLEPVDAIREAGLPMKRGLVVFQSVQRKLQRRLAKM